MKNDLDNLIEQATAEIEYHFKKLGFCNKTLTTYYFPLLQIDSFKPDPSKEGCGTAKIKAYVLKKTPQLELLNTENGKSNLISINYKDLDHYWQIGTKKYLLNKARTYAEKAYAVLEFVECLELSGDLDEWKLIENTKNAAMDIYEKLIRASDEKQEISYLAANAEDCEINVPELKGAHTIQIGNLVKNTILNPEIYLKLKEHSLNGHFANKIPFEVDIEVPIIID